MKLIYSLYKAFLRTSCTSTWRQHSLFKYVTWDITSKCCLCAKERTMVSRAMRHGPMWSMSGHCSWLQTPSLACKPADSKWLQICPDDSRWLPMTPGGDVSQMISGFLYDVPQTIAWHLTLAHRMLFYKSWQHCANTGLLADLTIKETILSHYCARRWPQSAHVFNLPPSSKY